MTYILIITLCLLILASYVFDISSSKTRIPSVMLLLLSGVVLKAVTNFLGLPIPDVKIILPLLGTIGLILIVLEGSLEIKITREKAVTLKKGLIAAIAGLAVFSILVGITAYWTGTAPFRDVMINVIPLGVISSAIAIPTAHALSTAKREFVVYESSFSDILGIMAFDYFISGRGYFTSIATFSFDIVAILVVSFISSLALGFLMNNITHHIKFLPILTILILVYSVARALHLPALILVLFFGLFLNNASIFFKRHWFGASGAIVNTQDLDSFKQHVGEFTFLVRSFFFIIFGYYASLASFVNPMVFVYAASLIIFIIASRAAVLKLMKVPLSPIMYIAPRGLITILLFFSIPASRLLPWMSEGLLTEVIFISAVVMMVGLMRHDEKAESLAG